MSSVSSRNHPWRGKRVAQGLAALFIAVALGLTLGAPSRAPAAKVVGLPSLADLAERLKPSVVNISSETTVQARQSVPGQPGDPWSEFFRRFFEGQPPGFPGQPQQSPSRKSTNLGSGLIVDSKEGLVLTNNHVIEKASEITVVTQDQKRRKATVVGRDRRTDLALLRIEMKPGETLPAVKLGDSDKLRVGDWVVAIGNPFGLAHTVTAGIVSAKGRVIGAGPYDNFIQTDASINPGNSGGALVNLRGELIGINTAIFSRSGGNIGIGFAIPSNIVQVIMDQLIRYGEVRRGHIGLEVQELNVELSEAFGLDRTQGVVVVRVDPESAADQAGLRPGDVILRFGERDVAHVVDYYGQAAVLMVGDEVSISMIREGEREKRVLAIGPRSFEKVAGGKIHQRLDGTLLQNYRSDDDIEVGAGVHVLEVQSGSYAYYYGLRAGDIIVAANRQAVHNISELTDGIELNPRRIELRIFREDKYYDALLR